MYLMFYLHTETDTQTQIYVKDIILQNNQTLYICQSVL